MLYGPFRRLPSSYLTKRQRQVYFLIARCKENREIAALLCICDSTVRTHIRNISERLGLREYREQARIRIAVYATSEAMQTGQLHLIFPEEEDAA